ncbi:MAG: sugar transferase [Ignavibacteria bacterium]|nr:sugar transferase [Ignavibacteria bacterium]
MSRGQAVRAPISEFKSTHQSMSGLATNLYSWSPSLFQFLSDCLGFVGSFFLYFVLTFSTGLFDISVKNVFWEIEIFLPILAAVSSYWVLLFWFGGLYKNWLVRSPFEEFFTIVRYTFIGCFLLFFLIIIDTQNLPHIRLKIVFYWITLIIVVMAMRLVVRVIQRYLRRKGIITLPVVLVGSTNKLIELWSSITTNPSWGYAIQGTILTDADEMNIWESKSEVKSIPILGLMNKLSEVIQRIRPQTLLISMNSPEHETLLNIASLCSDNNIRVKIVPDLYEVFSGQARTLAIYGAPLIEISPQLMKPWEETAKRLIDIVISMLVIILGSPIWLATAIAIKLDSTGGVFFNQIRVGKNGDLFKMYKYRSMVQDADKGKAQWTLPGDKRVTKFGRFLRKSHLDEVPQFLNVLKGEMSLVGPRPEQPFFVEKYSAILPYYPRRLKVRPGITGWWQVKYKQHTESVQEIESRLRDDFYYIENISLKLDIEILVRTVYCVVTGHGQT